MLVEELYNVLSQMGCSVAISSEAETDYGKADIIITVINYGINLRNGMNELIVEIKTGNSLSLSQLFRYLLDKRGNPIIVWRVRRRQVLVFDAQDFEPLLIEFMKMCIMRASRILSPSQQPQCQHTQQLKLATSPRRTPEHVQDFAKAVTETLPYILKAILEKLGIKAERIICLINIFRKAFKFIIFPTHLLLRRVLVSYFFPEFLFGGTISSYFLVICLLFFFRGSFLSYFLLPLFPLLMANVQQNLTPFLSVSQKQQENWEETDAFTVEKFKNGRGVRALAYVRVSTEKQAQHGFSLNAQMEELRQLARKRGASVLYWVIDAGKSGRDFDKRKLDVILDLAAEKRIDEVLVVDVDRVGRKSRKLMSFFLDLRDYGVIIVTPQGVMDVDDLAGLMMAALKSWAAQYENERRARASIAGKIQAFLQRRWNRPVPKGYRKAENGWIKKDPTWEPITKDIFSLFITWKNYRSVADAVNAKYATSLPEPLTRQQIASILCNPVYVGKPQYSGKVVDKHFKNTVVSDPALAFVDEPTFEKVQKIIDKIRQRHQRKDNVILKTMTTNMALRFLISLVM